MSARPRCRHAELAVGWALHALEPAEEDLVAEHLPQCDVCREAVRQTEELAWELSSAVDSVTPRAELRTELMASLATTLQLPKSERTLSWPAPESGPAGTPLTVGWHPDSGASAGDSSGAEWAAEQRRAARRRRKLGWMAVVVVAVLGVGGLVFRQAEIASQQQQVREVRPAQVNRILAQIAEPGAHYAVLNSPTGEPVAGVKASASNRQVLPYALPPNNTEHSMYVLWGISNADAVPLGGFDVTATDHGLRQVGSLPRDDDRFAAYVISIEQGRTVPQLPGLVVASGQVAS
jgi:anti-sigma-K factor RskA